MRACKLRIAEAHPSKVVKVLVMPKQQQPFSETAAFLLSDGSCVLVSLASSPEAVVRIPKVCSDACFLRVQTRMPVPEGGTAALSEGTEGGTRDSGIYLKNKPLKESVKVLFLTCSPGRGGSATDIQAWLCAPPFFPSMSVEIGSGRHGRVGANEVILGSGREIPQSGARLDIPHGAPVLMAASVNVVALYSAFVGKIWVMAARSALGEIASNKENPHLCAGVRSARGSKMEGLDSEHSGGHGRQVTVVKEGLVLIRCSVVDCNGPLYSMTLSYQYMLLGERGGVRVWNLWPLVKRTKVQRGSEPLHSVLKDEDGKAKSLPGITVDAKRGNISLRGGHDEGAVIFAERGQLPGHSTRGVEAWAEERGSTSFKFPKEVCAKLPGLGPGNVVCQERETYSETCNQPGRQLQISPADADFCSKNMVMEDMDAKSCEETARHLASPDQVTKASHYFGRNGLLAHHWDVFGVKYKHTSPVKSAVCLLDMKKQVKPDMQNKSFFIPFLSGKEIVRSTSALASQVTSIQQSSSRDFLVLNSSGQLHLLKMEKAVISGDCFTEMEMTEDLKQIVWTMTPLRTSLSIKSFAIIPPTKAGSAGTASTSERIWISDGAYSIHILSLSDHATLGEERKNHVADAESVLLSPLQALFSDDRVHSLASLSEDTILALTESEYLFYRLIQAVWSYLGRCLAQNLNHSLVFFSGGETLKFLLTTLSA